jgi:hypothetical protein
VKPLTRGQATGPSQGERRRNLEDALRDVFPEEDHAALIEMLLLAAEKEKIWNNELEMPVPVKEDLLMLLERERVLIPYGTSKTIAWEDRVLTFKPGETYEAPHVVTNMLNRAAETGELDPRYAFRKYLREIGEPEPEKMTSFFVHVLDNVENGRISAGTLSEIAGELSLEHRMGTIIAELKGGGVISPCLRDPSTLSYEVNPFLLKCRL